MTPSDSEKLEPVAWASEWEGQGGLTKALHLDKHEAHDNAKWMHGRSYALYTRSPDSDRQQGAIDPVIAQAMARSIVSFNLTALVNASRALLEACWAADAEEELPEHVDGSLMDAVHDALAALTTQPVPVDAGERG